MSLYSFTLPRICSLTGDTEDANVERWKLQRETEEGKKRGKRGKGRGKNESIEMFVFVCVCILVFTCNSFTLKFSFASCFCYTKDHILLLRPFGTVASWINWWWRWRWCQVCVCIYVCCRWCRWWRCVCVLKFAQKKVSDDSRILSLDGWWRWRWGCKRTKNNMQLVSLANGLQVTRVDTFVERERKTFAGEKIISFFS